MSEITRKNKTRFNVIDVVIVLLVLALIGTAAYRIYGEVTKNTSSKQSNCILTFEYTGTSESILGYLKAGDAVYLSKDGTLLGYLYDATPDDDNGAVYRVTDTEAEGIEKTTVKLRGSIKLSVDAHKAQGGGYYVINGTNITEGGKIEIYTENTEMNIQIKSLLDVK